MRTWVKWLLCKTWELKNAGAVGRRQQSAMEAEFVRVRWLPWTQSKSFTCLLLELLQRLLMRAGKQIKSARRWVVAAPPTSYRKTAPAVSITHTHTLKLLPTSFLLVVAWRRLSLLLILKGDTKLPLMFGFYHLSNISKGELLIIQAFLCQEQRDPKYLRPQRCCFAL